MLLFLTFGILAVSLAHLSFLKNNDLFLYLSFLAVLVVMAFQDSVSVDFPGYIETFNRIGYGEVRPSLFRGQADRADATEVGWYALNWLVGKLIPSFHVVAFIALGFYCFALVRMVQLVVPGTYRWLAVAYYYLGPILFNMSGIRQTVAIGFFILAVCAIVDNGDIWMAVLLVLLGSLFHNSMVFSVPFLLLVFLKKGEGWPVYVYMLVFVVLFSAAAFSGAKYQELFYEISNVFFSENVDVYSSYLSSMDSIEYSFKSLVRIGFPFVFAVLALPWTGKKEFPLFVLFIVGQILYALFGFEGNMQRITLYCTIFALPVFMVIANLIENKILRFAFCGGTLLLNLYMFKVMLASEQYAGLLNYDFFFWN